MVTTRRTKQYISNLGIILLLSILLISCSEAGDKFNLVLKIYSDNNDTGTISFKNLSDNTVTEKNIRTKKPLDIILDLNSYYEIEYKNETSDIYGYIERIRPIDYGIDKVYLTLNKNKTFRTMLHTISDTINDEEKYFYLYKENSIFRAQGDSFKKLSLLRSGSEKISKPFNISENKVINLDGNFLINESEIAFIDKNENISFNAHRISSLKFLNEKHIKINNNNNYFLITKKDNGNYNCINLVKEINDDINTTEVQDCIDFSIGENFKLLTQNQGFYIWDTDKLYKYQNSKFNPITELTSKSGQVFENNNKLFLISNKEIFLIDLSNNTFISQGLETLPFDTIKTFKINNTTTLITSETWQAEEKYYIFNDSSDGITLESAVFPTSINLKNIVNINIDTKQNIFLNDSSFEVSNQKFNSIKFYNFSFFK